MKSLIIRGEEFFIHDNEALSNAMERDQDFFEEHILDYVYEHFPVQGTIVDIGANIGNHSVYFARFFTYTKILSFEPISDNFELLVKNTEKYPNLYSEQKAISNHEGTIEMYRHPTNWGSHGAAYPDWQETLYVPNSRQVIPCITLDSLDIPNVTLLKIDVEMHEPQVLEGASKTIERCKPLILIEDVFQRYSILPQLKNYKLVSKWEVDYTYLYKWNDNERL